MAEKAIKWPKGVDTNLLPQHKRLATGLPLSKGPSGRKLPKTPC